MKKRVVIGLISLLSLAAYAIQNPGLERRISIGSSPIVVLSGDDCRIVLQPEASLVTRFAAEELQEFLSQVLGTKIAIVTVPGKRNNIYLGFSEFARKSGMQPEALARDGFYIRTVGEDIVIAGRDDAEVDPRKEIATGGAWSYMYERASLFGVYDFLERFCGVRFYFPTELGTVVPASKTITIPSINIVEKPDFLKRTYSVWWDGVYFEGEGRDVRKHPGKNLNKMRLRHQTIILQCCHGMEGFNLLERFGSTHPEYFRLNRKGVRNTVATQQDSGQLCLSSPVKEEIYQDIRAYLSGQPSASRNFFADGRKEWQFPTFPTFRKPYVDVMPHDSFQPCQCQSCKAAFTSDEEYATELVWNNVIDWAERLKKENIPGILSMMAYYPYRGIPKRNIPDNVVVMVATTGPWQINPEQQQKENDIITAWHKKLGRKVHLWNYALKRRGQTGLPACTPRAVGRYYKSSVAKDIFGMFMQSESDRFLYMAMNHYVLCKVAWDNQTDVDALMAEFYQSMFGPAAGVMQKLLDGFEDTWLRQIVGRTVDTNLGPVASSPSEYELWNKVYSPVRIDEIEAAFAQAKALVKPGSLEERRIDLYTREFFEPLRQAAADYQEKARAVQSLKFRIPDYPIRLRPFLDGKSETSLKTVDTIVSARCTDESLVLNFDCEEPNFTQVLAKKRAFDDPGISSDNSVEIFLNPSGDRKIYYQLVVNTAHSLTDWRWELQDKTSTPEIGWNSGATAKVEPNARGFMLEVTIPIKNLEGWQKNGFPVNFGRRRILSQGSGYHELFIWSPYAKGFHDLYNYGIMSPSAKEVLVDCGFDVLQPLKNNKCRWGIQQGSKFTGWSSSGSGDGGSSSCVLDNINFISAPNSMKIVADTGSQPGSQQCIDQVFSGKLKPLTKYRVSCAVKLENVVPNLTGGGFCINLWDEGNVFFPKHWLTGSTDWTYLSLVHTTSATVGQSPYSFLRAHLRHCTGTAWVDELSMEEIE